MMLVQENRSESIISHLNAVECRPARTFKGWCAVHTLQNWPFKICL